MMRPQPLVAFRDKTELFGSATDFPLRCVLISVIKPEPSRMAVNRLSAIDGHASSSDEARTLREKEGYDRRNVFGLAEAANWGFR